MHESKLSKQDWWKFEMTPKQLNNHYIPHWAMALNKRSTKHGQNKLFLFLNKAIIVNRVSCLWVICKKLECCKTKLCG